MGFLVTTEPTEEPITLTEAKLACREDTTTFDDRITRLIVAARQHAEKVTDRSLARKTITLYLDAWPASGDIELFYPPVATVTSVKYVDADGTLQTISSANYTLDTNRSGGSAWLLRAYDYDWPAARDVANAVQVVYAAGYTQATCPASVKTAIEATVASMYAQIESIAEAGRVPVAVGLYDGLLNDNRVVTFP